jgi:hypothetical protein
MSKNIEIINDLLNNLNKLKKESVILYYNIKTNKDKKLIIKYLEINKQIKNIEQFLIENVLNKSYYTYQIKKGIKTINKISSSYDFKTKDLLKLDYSFF